MELSFFNLVYTVRYKPLGDKQANRDEIINESVIFVCQTFMWVMLNLDIPYKQREALGWCTVVVAGSDISMNLLNMVWVTIQSCREDYLRKKYLRNANKSLLKRLKNREILLKEFPDRFKHFKHE